MEKAVCLRCCEEKVKRAAIACQTFCHLLREIDIARCEEEIHIIESRCNIQDITERVVIGCDSDGLLLEGGED